MTVSYPEALAGKQQMQRSRGARYRDYQPRTGMFFPLPPQKGVVI
jgi:steroid 5-alpha reductase family enzyme